MELRETERIELKRCVTDRMVKTIVAFANGQGGNIYVGIDDFGQVIGVDDIDGEMLKISSLVHDAICPELAQFVHIEPIELDGKRVILVNVEPGDEKPYYLAAKGLVPAGVFMRLGPATVPMGRRDIRRMIREEDGDLFETRHAPVQELTFEEAAAFFRSHHVDFSQERYRSLGFFARDGFYSNLALLVSDQNPYTLKCAVFNDDAGTEFLDHLECEGSVLRQFEDALRFLRLANNLRSYFPSETRIDQRDYPDDALREGLLNAIIHRDYDEGAHIPTLVKMYRTELSFTSFGSLFGITERQAITRESSPRNPALLALFHRLGEVEAYGSGLPKIWKLYEQEHLRASIEAEGSFFSLVLPNINTVRNPSLSLTRNEGPDLRGGQGAFEQLDAMGALPVRVKAAYDRACAARAEIERRQTAMAAGRGTSSGRCDIRTEQMGSVPVGEGCAMQSAGVSNGSAPRLERFLISFALGHEEFSREEAQEALGVGRDTALKVINGMVDEGALVKTGRARATRYRASDRLRQDDAATA